MKKRNAWDLEQGPPPEGNVTIESTIEDLLKYLKQDISYLHGVADTLNLPKLYGRVSSIEQNIMKLAAKCR